MNLIYEQYLRLVRHHLGARKNIAKALPYLEQFPEILDIHIGELNAVLNLFERYRRFETTRDPVLFRNTEYLIKVLGTKTLPAWKEMQVKILGSTDEDLAKDFDAIFKEIGTFQFPDMDLSPQLTLGTLFVSFYRTTTLAMCPYIRDAGGMVGSTIAEMLALLALEGCKTQLFFAEKIWILHHEGEGFTKELAERVRPIA